MVRSDFEVSGAALTLPYTGSDSLAPNVDWGGWSLGLGLHGSNFDGFSVFGDYPPAESSLAHAIENDLYLAATVGALPGYNLDLTAGAIGFEITRIQTHAPRNYAVFSSIAGWSVDAVLFDTGRIATQAPQNFAFSLPDELAYGSSEYVEFRIYAYGGRYFGHDTSLTDFHLDGTVRPSSDPVAPIITSPTEISMPEESLVVTNLTATDPDLSPGPLSFSLTGAGADDHFFSIVDDRLIFTSVPDFETPLDGGSAAADNIYEVEVQATDGEGTSARQTVFVTVTPVNEYAPLFTVSTFDIEENNLVVGQLSATDDDLPVEPLTYTLTGNGDDDDKFSLHGNILSFLVAPDFEVPNDVGDTAEDNIYEVEVRVADAEGLSATQTMLVYVLDDLELPSPEVLVRSDLSGIAHGNDLPHTNTELLSNHVEFSGWSLGAGLTGSEFEGLSFYGAYPGSESTLIEAVKNGRYLSFSASVDPGYTMDLRNGAFAFQIDRLNYHAPRQYVVTASVDGFTTSLFTSDRMASTGVMTFDFQLPAADEFSSLSAIEFRIYVAAGRYTGHDASLTEFELLGLVAEDVG